MSVPSPASPDERERARLERATASIDPPLAVLDLDALDANADALVRRAAGKPIRVASKSVRSRGVLRRVLARPGFAGVLAYSLHEALWLARRRRPGQQRRRRRLPDGRPVRPPSARR
jgi:D-serine deaminase-like pyridoxal phosphate-dependent protein